MLTSFSIVQNCTVSQTLFKPHMHLLLFQSRPFGVALLFAGIDKDGPQLWVSVQ